MNASTIHKIFYFSKLILSILAILLLELLVFSDVHAAELKMSSLSIPKGETLGLIGYSVLEFLLGKTKWVKSNSVIELGIDVLKFLFFKKGFSKTWRF